MIEKSLTAEVLLAIPLIKDSYDYLIPAHLVEELHERSLVFVKVQRQKKKEVSLFLTDSNSEKNLVLGIILKIRLKDLKKGIDYKYVLDVVKSKPVVFPKDIKLWNWLSDYYLYPLGTIFTNAFSMTEYIKRQNQKTLHINQHYLQNQTSYLSNEQQQLLLFVKENSKKKYRWFVNELKNETIPAFFDLFKNNILYTVVLKPRPSSKDSYVFLEENLNLDALQNKLTHRQSEVFNLFFDLCKKNSEAQKQGLSKSIFSSHKLFSKFAFQKLLDKGIFKIHNKKYQNLKLISKLNSTPILSPAQHKAYTDSVNALKKKMLSFCMALPQAVKH